MNIKILLTKTISEITLEKYMLDSQNYAHIDVALYLKPKSLEWEHLVDVVPEIMRCLAKSIKHERKNHGKTFLLNINLYTFKNDTKTESKEFWKNLFDLCGSQCSQLEYHYHVNWDRATILVLKEITPISILTYEGPYHSHWIGFREEEIKQVKSRIKREIISFVGSKQGKESMEFASHTEELPSETQPNIK